MKQELKSREEKQPTHSKCGFRGTVIRISSPKTLAVEVVSYTLHPKYRKKHKNTKRYLVHDETESFAVGDRVEFIPSRAHSKKKRFEVLKKV